MTMVSVIMTAYNVEAYIEKAIQSIIDYPPKTPYELIIIDDCSTDKTWDIIQGYDLTSIVRHKNIINLGLAATRNIALTMMRGEWVTFLDADDFYLPGRIDALYEVAISSDVDMVADDVWNFIDGNFDGKISTHEREGGLFRYFEPISISEYIEHYTTTVPMIRKSFLSEHKLKFNEDRSHLEDLEFWIECLLNGARFIWIPEAYYCYRGKRPNSLSKDVSVLASRASKSLRLLMQHPTARSDQNILQALASREEHIAKRAEVETFKNVLRNRRFLSMFQLLLKSSSVRSGIVKAARKRLWKNA